MTERLVIVGAGPAGLCAAWHARAQGVEPLIIDAAPRPGGAWASMDPAMRCLSPRHLDRLPDGTTPAGPGALATAAEVLECARSFAQRQGFRARMGERVERLHRPGRDFVLDTPAGRLSTRALIAATGIAGAPRPLTLSGRALYSGHVEPAFGLHDRLGAVGARVLVIGAGTSGADAVQLLLAHGREVTVATRGPLRSQPPHPPGVRGRLSWALSGVPTSLLPPAARCGPVFPIDDRLQRLVADDAVRLVGQAVAFAADGVACRIGPGAGAAPSRVVAVDTVVVAIGYRRDLDWIQLPSRDAHGAPPHRGGFVATARGLGLLGLDCMRTRRSGFLRGFDGDARAVVAGVLRQTGDP